MISMIVAATQNNVIGREGSMPWRLKGDMKHFVDTTRGKPVVMGRKTYDSIGKPLKGRRTIILTRDQTLTVPGCEVIHTLADIQTIAASVPELIIAGGAEIYRMCLPLADRIYLTRIACELDGDAFFPELEQTQWQTRQISARAADENNDQRFNIYVLDKKPTNR